MLTATAVLAFIGGGGLLAWGAIAPDKSWGNLPYQGFLELNGVPVNGNHDFCFQLYADATGTSPLWAEAQGARAVTAGAFSVRLGDSTALNAAVETAANLFLEVGVAPGGTGGACPGGGYTTLAGRQQLGAAPYALSAKRGIPGEGFLVDGALSSNGVSTPTATVTGLAEVGSLTVSGAVVVPNASLAGAKLAADPIACATWQANVSNSGGGLKTVTATIPDASYARTGGGCDCGSNNPGRLVVTNTVSGTNGWTCTCKDHSAGDGQGVTTATVVGCRLH